MGLGRQPGTELAQRRRSTRQGIAATCSSRPPPSSQPASQPPALQKGHGHSPQSAKVCASTASYPSDPGYLAHVMLPASE